MLKYDHLPSSDALQVNINGENSVSKQFLVPSLGVRYLDSIVVDREKKKLMSVLAALYLDSCKPYIEMQTRKVSMLNISPIFWPISSSSS
mmetsp:Transcript_8429/g.12853  ORF Transcript_8429/g.12853 Transcript_8429/m.12853 type:complete len:90 (+) Transcript_8429:2413-2682(+)